MNEMLNRIIREKYQYLKPFNCVRIWLWELDRNTWNYLIVYKQMSSGLFKNNVANELFVYKSYIFNIYIYVCVCVCVCVCV